MIIQSNKKYTLVLEKVNYVHIDFFVQNSLRQNNTSDQQPTSLWNDMTKKFFNPIIVILLTDEVAACSIGIHISGYV